MVRASYHGWQDALRPVYASSNVNSWNSLLIQVFSHPFLLSVLALHSAQDTFLLVFGILCLSFGPHLVWISHPQRLSQIILSYVDVSFPL